MPHTPAGAFAAGQAFASVFGHGNGCYARSGSVPGSASTRTLPSEWQGRRAVSGQAGLPGRLLGAGPWSSLAFATDYVVRYTLLSDRVVPGQGH